MLNMCSTFLTMSYNIVVSSFNLYFIVVRLSIIFWLSKQVYKFCYIAFLAIILRWKYCYKTLLSNK